MTTPSKSKKIWLLPALALLAFAGAWLVFRLMFPPFAPPILPVPNGYDDLLRAAKMVAPRTGFYRDENEMDEVELTAIVEGNEPALKLAREALQKECIVTVNWSANQTDMETHLAKGSSMRHLGWAFAAAARLAKNKGQMDEAVRCGLDVNLLAQAASRGGLMIDRGYAGGVHYTAMYSLLDQVELLSRDDCLRLQKKLQASPLQLDEIHGVIRRDQAYMRQVHGLYMHVMMSRMIRSQQQQSLAEMQKIDNIHAVMNTLLQTHLALRAFQLDNNQYPETLDELVPDYLEKLPQDSFASKPLHYRQTDDSYLLYSVGPDGVDNQGIETKDNVTGDLLLEADD